MIGFIGGGNMAEALIKGIRQSGGIGASREIIVSEPRAERREFLERTYGVKTTEDNVAVVKAAPIFILAVKPQQMEEVLTGIAPHVTASHTVVSIAAGVTLGYLGSKLTATRRIVRVMPNVASMVQEGMSAMSFCECFNDAAMNDVRGIFMGSGRVAALPERLMDGVTALSGSGPAFVALFIDAMVEGAVKEGLSREDAITLGVQTLRGTAALLETGIAPGELIRMVKSPGGTTAQGLGVFEERGLGAIVGEAIAAAARRSRELAR